jgi:dihydroflavonol-4-reductase
LLDPAVKGTEAVLGAATRAGTVKKVVVTSSVAAVFSDAWEKGRGHVFSASDWNEAATETFLPYHRAKTLAEQAAWAAAKAAKGRWALATIVPPVILGPPPGNVKCEVVGLARRIMTGAMFPATAPVGLGIVDVEDCAAAHTLAALIPSASGRYIVCGAETTLLAYASQLKPEFGMYK